MDSETRRRVEEAVLDVLKRADMETATEERVRTAAAQRLGLDLSLPDCRLFVRSLVESFLLSHKDEDVAPSEKYAGVASKKSRKERAYGDNGELIVCRLSSKRRVTLQEFKGRKLVSIREYYEKDGKQLPSTKGISLTVDQWEAFRKAVPAIENAIKKMETDA